MANPKDSKHFVTSLCAQPLTKLVDPPMLAKEEGWNNKLLGLHQTNAAQYPERVLNKISKTFSKTYAGLKSTLQRFRIYSFQNPSSKGMESTS